MTNTNPASIRGEMPSVGAATPPPELISSVDADFVPKDSHPENTDRMTGGTQPGDPDKVSNSELGVGEMEGASFKVEPLRRTGEDKATMRARLLCPLLPDRPVQILIGVCVQYTNLCRPKQEARDTRV